MYIYIPPYIKKDSYRMSHGKDKVVAILISKSCNITNILRLEGKAVLLVEVLAHQLVNSENF